MGKNIALYASSSAKTFCLPEALNFVFFLSTNSLQTETGVLVTVNDTELVKVPSEKPRVGQNIALYASPTARKSTFCFPGFIQLHVCTKGPSSRKWCVSEQRTRLLSVMNCDPPKLRAAVSRILLSTTANFGHAIGQLTGSFAWMLKWQ